ncbi:MAG: hypothetical protein KDD99_07360 [Bacteroidetes bacterium]|nr:hypothetical protein [Bacteroidota bacterium]
MKKLEFLIIILFCMALTSRAQDSNSLLKQIQAEDQVGIEALAFYSDSLLTSILAVSSYPEVLVRAQDVQQQTQAKLQEIIAPFNRQTQADFYELARYPGLMETIANTTGKPSKNTLKTIAESYPEEVQSLLPQMGSKYYEEIIQIHQIEIQAEQAMGELIKGYPAALRENFWMLVDNPQVLDVLMEHFHTAVVLGAEYKANPEAVYASIAQMREELITRDQEELESWKSDLESDPDAIEDLKEAAEEYANENNIPSPPTYKPSSAEDGNYVRVEHYYYSYPYWLGYPYWYQTPIWYPMAYWNDWGFYYLPGRSIVVFDLPSWYFVNWYFTNPYHHYYYPYLSRYYIRHYERHPHSTRPSTIYVRDWVSKNRNVNGENWLNNDQNRIRRLRTYGLQEGRRVESQVNLNRRSPVDEPYMKPDKRNRTTPVYRQPSTNRSNTINQTEPNRPRQLPNLNQAPEYHKRTWEKTRPTVVRPVPQNKMQNKGTLIKKPIKRN